MPVLIQRCPLIKWLVTAIESCSLVLGCMMPTVGHLRAPRLNVRDWPYYAASPRIDSSAKVKCHDKTQVYNVPRQKGK